MRHDANRSPATTHRWILLADSFAIGMVLLGLSGIWMWARGRTPRQMVLSVMGLTTLAFLAVVGLALL